MWLLEPHKFKNSNNSEFIWVLDEHLVFKQLSKSFSEVSALNIYDISKPFQLFVHESKGVMTQAVLTRTFMTWKGSVRYQSKRLDLVALGWLN